MWRRLLDSGWIRFVAVASLVAVLPIGEAWGQADDELPSELLMGPDGERPVYQKDGRIWWMGWQVFLARDQMTGEQPINYDWGLGFSIPVMMDLYKGLGTRIKLAATYSGDPPLNDAVTHITYVIPSEEAGQQDIVVDKDLPGYMGVLQFNSGISYTHPLLEGAVNPYAGFGPTVMLMLVFPDLAESDAILLDNVDPSNDDEVDPYSVNVALGVNAYFGVNFALAHTLHLSVEAEYTQAGIPETHLEKAKNGFQTSRPEFTYGAFTVSTGLVWHF